MKRLLLCVLVLASWLMGCSAFVDSTQLNSSLGVLGPIATEHTVGQTFVARHGGLNGIDVFLDLEGEAGIGTAILHLRNDPASSRDVALAHLPLTTVSESGFYTFSFPPIQSSNGRRYYTLLETRNLPEGTTLRAGYGPAGTYHEGAMYESGEPLDQQLAFQLRYAWSGLLISMLQGFAADLVVLITAFGLFILPGWAMLAYLSPQRALTWGEVLGLAAGLSLALYPLLFLWTYIAEWRAGPLVAFLPLVLAALALGWKYRSRLTSISKLQRGHLLESAKNWHRSGHAALDITLLGLLGLIFATRLIPIHGLNIPLWADSVQHTAITQLILDHSGLFTNWLPYWPYETFSQHYGFHANAAVWIWATGVETPQGVLIFGQVLNALAVLTLYPLARRIGDRRWAGVIAVMVAGLLSKMPAFYVNWGRYAQLAGQAILPTAILLTWHALDQHRFTWRSILLAAIPLAGMTLAYYRTPYFYAPFWLAWGILVVVPRLWRSPDFGLTLLTRGASIGGVTLVLILPWIPVVIGSNLLQSVTHAMAVGPSVERVLAEFNDWKSVDWYVPQSLIIVWILGVIWSILKRQWTATLVGLWVLILALLPAARLIRLPGASHIINFAVFIALYIPASLILGWLGGEFITFATDRRISWQQWLVAGTVLVIASLGAQERIKTIDPEFMLVTRPDEVAMEWIQSNTPQTAKLLVNGMIYTDGWSVIGGDAGWWIPLLTKRQNTMPPQYALFNEQPIEPGYDQRMIEIVRQLLDTPPTSPAGIALLCDNSITHIYIGQEQGMVVKALPNPPDRPLLEARELAASPIFKPVYHEDRVWVFELDQRACQ